MMKAMSHPLRMRILDRLIASTASPSAIATDLGEPLGNVSYHVKILLRYGAIELVETRPVRGALEHVYRAVDVAHVSRTTLELDAEGEGEMANLIAETLDRALVIQTKAADRLADGGRTASRVPTELLVCHYQRPSA